MIEDNRSYWFPRVGSTAGLTANGQLLTAARRAGLSLFGSGSAGLVTAFLSLFLIWSPGTEAAIPIAERDALEDLYFATAGAGWTNNSGWLGPVGTECTWRGVHCDPDETTILRLELPGNNLRGTLPDTLNQLPNLEKLYLSWNFLHGSIPNTVFTLDSLKNLSLRDNYLFGSIPDSIGDLQQLEVLDLSSNYLHGGMPASIGQLASLQHLSVKKNRFHGPIPSEIGNLSNLRSLYLTWNSLSSSVPNTIVNLQNLDYCSLSGNFLYSTDPAVVNFLNTHCGTYWQAGHTYAPSNFHATNVSDSCVVLAWESETSLYDRGHFEILVTAIDGTVIKHLQKIPSLLRLSWPIFGLDPSTPYRFRIRTVLLPDSQTIATLHSTFSEPIEVSTLEAPMTMFVSQTGDDSNDCSTWKTACVTVQRAVDMASEYCEIRIGEGQFLGPTVVDKSLRIIGAGPTASTLDGENIARVLTIEPNTFLQLENIGVQRGVTQDYGGGIFIGWGGFLFARDLLVQECRAGGSGGGIYGHASITTSVIRNNEAVEFGGGLAVGDGEISNCIVSANTARSGGGIFADRTKIIDTVVSENTGLYSGGGIFLGQSGTILRSSIVHNLVEGGTGGVFVGGLQRAVILDSTIGGNSGIGVSAGMYGSVTLTNVTVAENEIGIGSIHIDGCKVQSSILASNKEKNCSRPLLSLGFNLIDDESCEFDSTFDMVVPEALLQPLETGSISPHYPLYPRSAARNAGITGLSQTDQRGNPRYGINSPGLPENGESDIGAIEMNAPLFGDGFEWGDLDSWSHWESWIVP